MRIRARGVLSQKGLVCAAMAGAGLIILLFALPPWLLFSFVGAGLVAGAYFVFKTGI